MTTPQPPPESRTIRRRRMGTTEIIVRELRPSRAIGSGSLRSLSGFAIALAVGTGLLMLPTAAAAGRTTTFIEALFTATSALCVTGHVVFDTQAHFSGLGEVIILLLIQVGGLGYMLGTTVILWAMGRQMGMRDRELLRLYYGAPSMTETLSFARTIALYTFAFEGVGALILWGRFLADGRPVGEAAWWGVFHSVSAFNNAGFSVTGNDMVPYQTDYVALSTIAILVIFGGLGAIPVLTLMRHRSWRRLPLDNKLIFMTTSALIVGGTLVFGALEWTNQATIGAVDPGHRGFLAFFQAVMPRTAGFSAVPIDMLHDETKFFTIALMFIGGAAGSTAGGVKVGTFSLLLVAMLATFRGRDEAIVLRRQIPDRVIRQALVIALGGIAVVFAFSMALTIASDGETFIDVMFDTVSALGTVGLSTGPTARGNTGVEVLTILAMLVGRFGPLVIVLEMNRQRRKSTYRAPEDSIRLG
ncbi:MAG: potassium transporter TrkG [Dehalococcoidia bacterium]|nr:Trk family potassium uptake protein [Dehalococcoidia bacterium]MCB9484778.1 Trk family potassium uptake protein [Thermoflexaceae bacterium]